MVDQNIPRKIISRSLPFKVPCRCTAGKNTASVTRPWTPSADGTSSSRSQLPLIGILVRDLWLDLGDIDLFSPLVKEVKEPGPQLLDRLELGLDLLVDLLIASCFLGPRIGLLFRSRLPCDLADL